MFLCVVFGHSSKSRVRGHLKLYLAYIPEDDSTASAPEPEPEPEPEVGLIG